MTPQRKTRRQVLTVLGGASVALLAACAPAAQPPASPPTTKPTDAKPAAGAAAAAPKAVAPAQQGTVEATFWFNMPNQQAGFQKIIDRFHQSQSRVRMNVVLVPGSEMGAKLATAIAGGEPPDAVRLGGPALNALFINNGHAAALDDWDPKIGTYDWIPSIQKAVTRNGKMYAMPSNSGVQAFFYNKDLYQAAGLDPEKPPTTLDQVLEIAPKIAASGEQKWGHYTLTAPNSSTGADYFPTMLWAFGGREVSEDGSKITFNSAEGEAALTWYKKLVDAKGMPVKRVDETTMQNDFLTGNVGSMISFPAALARVAQAPFKAGTAVIPAGPRGGVAPVGFGTVLVLDKAKNREAGWEFARFIGLDASNSAFWNMSFGQLPPRASFREDPTWKEYEGKNPLVRPFLDAQKNTDISYYGPGAQEIGTEVGKAVEAVVFGQKSPKQALDDAARVGQTILDRERAKAS